MITKKQQVPSKIDELINNVKLEIKKEPWYWHVMNLAWTAGPVTLIAVYISYYIGYGKLTSIETVIYFGIYTILAGMLSIFFQTVKNAAVNPQVRNYKYQLNLIIDKFLDYISFCKEDLSLSFPESQKDLMYSWWILTSSTSDINMIQQAVFLATKNEELAGAIKRIEFYRKQGFDKQLLVEYQKVENMFTKAVRDIEPVFPSLAECLKLRFKGKFRRTKSGVERPQGFLSRMLNAANEESDEYTGIEDLIGVLNLVIELIMDRRILVFYPDFSDDKKFEILFNEYEEKISDFKLIRRLRNNKARELVSIINDRYEKDRFSTYGSNSEQLNDILKELKETAKYKKFLASKEARDILEEIKRKNKKMKHMISRLDVVYSKNLIKTNWENINFSIKENYIYLDDSQKIDVLNRLSKIILKKDKENMSIENIKSICFDIIDILDEKLNISEPEEQIAIEESMATDLNDIEPNFTTSYKISVIANYVNELQQSKTKTVHRFARHLVQHYNLKLSDELKLKIIVDFFGEKECLDSIEQIEREQDIQPLESFKKEIFTVF